MTPRQRVESSLRHVEPDRVPVFELMINRPVAEAVMGRELLEGSGPGGYVLSSSNSIHSGVRPNNFLAMVDEAKRT